MLNHSEFAKCLKAHRTHQGVKYTDSKGSAAGKGLSEVQLRVWVIIVVLVQELNIRVIHWETGRRAKLQKVKVRATAGHA